MGSTLEPAILEQWMIQPGLPVQEEHAEQRRERRQKNRQFIADWKCIERAEQRLAANHQLVVEPVHVPDHAHANAESSKPAQKAEITDVGILQAHRRIHSVDREW